MTFGFSRMFHTALLAATVPVAACAQSALPPTELTRVTPSQLPSANPATPAARALDMEWDGHLLQLSASGQGLNEALRAIARRTGMHLVGSTPDEPLFGTYGPAPLADVLAELVDGLHVNMLFVDRSANKPPELSLSMQNGMATPPQPQSEPQAQVQIQPSFQPQRFQANPPGNAQAGQPQVYGSGVSVPNSSLLNGQNGNSQTQTTGTDSDTAGNPESPNGVKTPQQIFEQLQRLRANPPK